MTANFDAAKSAALAYAAAMARTASALADALAERGLPVFATSRGRTASHQFALAAAEFGGGQTAAKRLRLTKTSLPAASACRSPRSRAT